LSHASVNLHVIPVRIQYNIYIIFDMSTLLNKLIFSQYNAISGITGTIHHI